MGCGIGHCHPIRAIRRAPFCTGEATPRPCAPPKHLHHYASSRTPSIARGRDLMGWCAPFMFGRGVASPLRAPIPSGRGVASPLRSGEALPRPCAPPIPSGRGDASPLYIRARRRRAPYRPLYPTPMAPRTPMPKPMVPLLPHAAQMAGEMSSEILMTPGYTLRMAD
jgi:hypothetical protein